MDETKFKSIIEEATQDIPIVNKVDFMVDFEEVSVRVTLSLN